MNHEIVLIGGIGFIIFAGVVLFLGNKAEARIESKTKRLAHLLAFGIIAIACILVFEWYSSDYIANRLTN